jgi:hypothetical protein
MKKMLAVVVMFVLTGCAEKQEYEQAVLEEMKLEKDIKDYKVEPEKMTECVVTKSSKDMPGMFPLDPERMKAYKNYAKMLQLNHSADPKKMLEELRADFESPKNLAEAHANYMESVLECMSGLVTSAEQGLAKGSEKSKADNTIR